MRADLVTDPSVEAAVSWLRLFSRWRSALVYVLFVVFAACSPGTAAPPAPPTTTGPEVLASEPRAAKENGQIEELLRRTRTGGSVRVIVQLRIPSGPDETREQRVQSARQALLAELARVPHAVLRTYVVTPAVALEASHPALQILRDSPHVSRVDEDALAKPFSKPKP
jgi:hypothetical protein